MPSPFRSASLTAPGESRPVAWSPSTVVWPAAVLDDHAIEPLVGVDEVGLAVAGEVGHGQRDGLVGLAIGPEGAVAVAQEDQHIAVGVADQEVGHAVAVDVGDRQAGGLGPGVVGDRRLEAALAVAQHRCSRRWRSRTARSGMPS